LGGPPNPGPTPTTPSPPKKKKKKKKKKMKLFFSLALPLFCLCSIGPPNFETGFLFSGPDLSNSSSVFQPQSALRRSDGLLVTVGSLGKEKKIENFIFQ
jgi:hypothetical protein